MSLIARLVTWTMRVAVSRARLVLVVAGAAVLLAALLTTRLEPDTSPRTLLGDGSPSYQATERSQDLFGSDAIVVRIGGKVANLVLTSDLERVLGLEGCIAGKQATAGQSGPCARLAVLQPAQSVIGPGTFINTSASQIADEFDRRVALSREQASEAAKDARKLARAQGLPEDQVQRAGQAASQAVQQQALVQLGTLGLQFGILQKPTINDQTFVSKLVFENGQVTGPPKQRFAYLFPTRDTALITVRLRRGLTEQQQKDAIADIRAATRMSQWQLKNGGTYAVTGAPVVLSDLTGSISDALLVLGAFAIVVMALVLALMFRTRRRLVPLLVALAAAAVTFGLLALVGASLTVAAVAVAPIMIGLVVDYALQLQARIADRRARGDELVPAVAAVARDDAPTIAAAALTTAAGFCVLVISPVPMVRAFGLLLVVAVLVGLATALLLGPAALAVRGRSFGPRALTGRLGAAGSGASLLLRDNPLTRAGARFARRVSDASARAAEVRPDRVLLLAGLVALVGFAAETQISVESDVTKLAPQNLDSLTALRGLQESTGVGGQIDVLVEGKRVTDPAVVKWMSTYQQRVLKSVGYSDKRGCGKADLCPAFSLPDLLSGFKKPTQAQIEGLLKVIPDSFSQNVITQDRRAATVAFGIRLMSLERQSKVLERMRDELDPPEGVKATVVGLPVLAADANEAISSPVRRLLTLLAGLLVVGAVLRLLLGDWRRVLVPLVPIVIATGWAPLILLVTRIPLNPMSVTLSALVVAIATEFSVLLSERHRRARENGASFAEALAETYGSTGRSVVVSAVTAIAGFAVLIASQIRMLRDFGLVTVIDLAVAVLAVLVILPSAIAMFASDRQVGDDRAS